MASPGYQAGAYFEALDAVWFLLQPRNRRDIFPISFFLEERWFYTIVVPQDINNDRRDHSCPITRNFPPCVLKSSLIGSSTDQSRSFRRRRPLSNRSRRPTASPRTRKTESTSCPKLRERACPACRFFLLLMKKSNPRKLLACRFCQGNTDHF